MASKKPAEASAFESMTKLEVRALADAIGEGGADVTETCVAFVCAETVHLWHGRGRAMLCRRLKHIQLTPDQKIRLVSAILARLSSGTFSEQFRDQLRLALHLNPLGTYNSARRAATSEREHISRLARWVLSHEPPAPAPN